VYFILTNCGLVYILGDISLKTSGHPWTLLYVETPSWLTISMQMICGIWTHDLPFGTWCHVAVKAIGMQSWEQSVQGCRIFLGTTYQNRKNYTNSPWDGHKYTKWFEIFVVAIRRTNSIHSKALRNLPKSGFLVRKYTIWQPWLCALIMDAMLCEKYSRKESCLRPKNWKVMSKLVKQ
jgi:hypothetical protein